MAILAVSNLSLGYESKVIVEDLNFSIQTGDYLCIIGENGSGKTTLIKALLGLKAPLRGKVHLGDGLKRNEIGYLPQQTVVQRDFPASVWEIVLSGCQGHCGRRPFYNQEEKQCAMDALRRMGISQLKECCYRELSGGQKQRVLLARALCATGRLLFLDEPVAGLDPGTINELYKQVAKLNKEGITIVMISHDVTAAMRDASHILQLGRHRFFGKKEAYCSQRVSSFMEEGQRYAR